jgi:hypothetical protein
MLVTPTAAPQQTEARTPNWAKPLSRVMVTTIRPTTTIPGSGFGITGEIKMLGSSMRDALDAALQLSKSSKDALLFVSTRGRTRSAPDVDPEWLLRTIRCISSRADDASRLAVRRHHAR